MSNAIFPALPGLMWDVKRTPIWSTKIQQSASRKEVRASFMSTPVWRWALKFEVLRSASAFNEFQTLVGFYNARQGSFDSFLYTDPTDSSIPSTAPQAFGTGNGATTAFQLQRAFGGFIEPVHDLNGTPTILINGVAQGSGYSVGATGIVTFTTPPANGAALTWYGAFFWRVRFDQDQAEFNNFLSQLWELQQLAFVSVK